MFPSFLVPPPLPLLPFLSPLLADVFFSFPFSFPLFPPPISCGLSIHFFVHLSSCSSTFRVSPLLSTKVPPSSFLVVHTLPHPLINTSPAPPPHPAPRPALHVQYIKSQQARPCGRPPEIMLRLGLPDSSLKCSHGLCAGKLIIIKICISIVGRQVAQTAGLPEQPAGSLRREGARAKLGQYGAATGNTCGRRYYCS